MTQYTSWTIESRCQLDDKVERHHLIASCYCSNTWVMCWCSLNKILFHPRTSLPTIIATAIQATVYSDSKCMNLPPQILPQKGDEYPWPLQCMPHTHKSQPWHCFLGSGNLLIMPLGWLVGPCTLSWASFTDNAHADICIEPWHHDIMTHVMPLL